MVTRTYKFLSYDKTRCFGNGCLSKATCSRYKQIEMDREADDGTERRLSYIATGIDKESDTCSIRIEE